MDEAVSLGGTEWTLVELGGVPVDFAEGEPAPFLVLDLEESQVTGSGGCNRLVGSFTLSEDELRFGPLASTRMACADAVMERERMFLSALELVSTYELDEQSLTLLAGDEPVARLSC